MRIESPAFQGAALRSVRRERWRLAGPLLVVLLAVFAPDFARATQTTVHQNPSETSLDASGGVLDQLYGLSNLTRVEDFSSTPNDQVWFQVTSGLATAEARYASLTHRFGYFDGSGSAFTQLFQVSGAQGILVGGPSAIFSVAGPTFRFGLKVVSGSTVVNTWSSQESENTDGAKDHLVVWRIAGPGNRYALAWEDLAIGTPAPSAPEPDYNDLVIEVSGVAPFGCGNGVVDPGEDCDDGNTANGDCCSETCLAAVTGTPCADADLCNGAETCQAGGVCGAGTPLVCNDGNACTDDSCNPSSGCVATPNTAPCSDGSACTVGDSCSGGSCVSGAPLVCNDGNACTDDSCNASIGCIATPNTAPCDDGSACTVGDACSGGSCAPGAPLVCNDGNVCTDDSCNPSSGCVATPNTASCSDGSACTVGDVCASGTCTAGAPLACDDGNVCTDDSCNPSSGCVTTPNASACDDGSACTVGDFCSGGACSPGGALPCDDGDACTVDSCQAASGCLHVNNPSICPVPTESVQPIVECVVENSPNDFTAHFGYLNANPAPVTIPAGADNAFSPAPIDRGQTTTFAPGRSSFYPATAFQVNFDGSGLVWSVRSPNGTTLATMASSSSARCPTPPNNVRQYSICYGTANQIGLPPPENVELQSIEDTFENKNFDLTRTKTLCAPVELTHDGHLYPTVDSGTHLLGRTLVLTRTKPAQAGLNPRDPVNQNIQVDDIFGSRRLDISRLHVELLPGVICNPTIQSCPANPADLSLAGIGTDEFKCYTAKGSAGSPRFPRGINVAGVDSFQSRVYRVTGPKVLCTRANRNAHDPAAVAATEGRLCYGLGVPSMYCEPGSPAPYALASCRKASECGGGRCVFVPRPLLNDWLLGVRTRADSLSQVLTTLHPKLLCVPAEITR